MLSKRTAKAFVVGLEGVRERVKTLGDRLREAMDTGERPSYNGYVPGTTSPDVGTDIGDMLEAYGNDFAEFLHDSFPEGSAERLLTHHLGNVGQVCHTYLQGIGEVWYVSEEVCRECAEGCDMVVKAIGNVIWKLEEGISSDEFDRWDECSYGYSENFCGDGAVGEGPDPAEEETVPEDSVD